MEEMEEKELIERCRQGDESAFEALIRLHEKRVYALCRRMCRREEDAMEAAQDAFLALWRGIGGYREDAAFSTWLYRLTVNACLDLLRREKRRGDELSLDGVDERLRDPLPGPEEAAERSETARLVREAMLSLPPDYRQVLLLRETEQLSYAEIEEITGLAAGTVKSRLSRARLALRNYLAASGNFFGRGASNRSEKQGKEAERQ